MNRRFVSSLGQPYFAFVADNVGDSVTLPGHGLLAVEIDFRLDALPTQSASADEIHPLFAFDHDLATQPIIFEAGVTPSGRIKAQAKDGGTWSSPVGAVAPGAGWRTLQVFYALGAWQVLLDGIDITAAGTTVAGTGAVYLLPNAGYNVRLMLFNGQGGLARTAVSVSRLLATFESGAGSISQILQWGGFAGSGNTLESELFLFSEAAKFSAVPLSARWYEPLFTHPWGAVPTGEPNEAYAWGLETDYTAVARPVTTYTRVSE